MNTDLVALARAGRPYEFLRAALPSLDARSDLAPAIAENLVALGLRTPAAQVLGLAGVDAPSVRARIESLRDDRFALDARAALLTKNVVRVERDCIGAHGLDLPALARSWLEREAMFDVLATNAGSVIRRPGGSLDVAAWCWFAEQRGEARAFAERNLGDVDPGTMPPITIEGVNPPWILAEVARATPRTPNGYQALLRVVQADPDELFEGLSLIDLDAALGDRSVRWYLGPRAGELFAADIARDDALRITGPAVPIASVRTRAAPAPEQTIEAAGAAQLADLAATRERVDRGRDEAFWSARYERALAPSSSEPLRVLIPTCRFTTYIQHAAEGLAQSCRALGWRAELLIEPDDASQLSALAYWRAAERLDPDLIVLINYPRAVRPEAFPRDVPFVCWIQDRMPRLFGRSIGESQAPLDFLCGLLPPPLFGSYLYPRERALAAPVLPSERTFHDAPIDQARAERVACDVAAVTNHAETPDAMHDRLVAEQAASCARSGEVLTRLRAVVDRAADIATRERCTRMLVDAAREALVGAGLPSSADAPNRVVEHYARPLLDRTIRHRALGWTAELCERHAWRFHLYGRGWDQHPTLARYAMGPVRHGEDLRACYAAARCHLHIAASSLVHQRVMECALAGGLPLAHLLEENSGDPIEALARDGVLATQAVSADETGATFDIASSPTLIAETFMRQRAGLPVRTGVRVPRSRIDDLVGPSRRCSPGPIDLFGDPGELGFASKGQLEEKLSRAIGDDAWRGAWSSIVRTRVRAHASQERLLTQLVRMIGASLGESARERSAQAAA